MFGNKKPQRLIRFDTTSVKESVKIIRGIVAGHAALLGTQSVMLENLVAQISEFRRVKLTELGQRLLRIEDGVAVIESSVVELLNEQRETRAFLADNIRLRKAPNESASPPLHDR